MSEIVFPATLYGDGPIFNAIRAAMGRIDDEDFDIIKAGIIAACQPPQAQPAPTPAPATVAKILNNPAAFFDSIRPWANLTTESVAGFERLIKSIASDAWPIAWAAYGLATPWWETAKSMTPVDEGYYLGAERAKRHQRSLRYYPWYGRGDVQLTWKRNYQAADAYLASIGLIQPGELIANPDLAMRPDISAAILVWGMKLGKFTGKGLGDYLPRDREATHAEFKQARRIINGTDKWVEIANVAERIQAALKAGDYR